MTQAENSRFEWLGYLLKVTVVFLLYFVAGRIGLSVPFTRDNVSPLWPAAGISLGAVLLWGYRIWPGIVLGAFLTNFTTGIPALSSGLIALGNTSSGLIGAYLLHRLDDFRPSLVRLRDVLALVTVGAMLGPISSATFGVTALYLAHLQPWSHFPAAWRIWWCGDAMGILVAAPLFLAASELRRPILGRRVLEFAGLSLGVVALCLAIFTQVMGTVVRDDVLAFLLFPFVMWAAIRFRIAGASTVCLIITGLAVWGTAHGYGPFVAHPALHDIALLQLFIAVAATTGLTLAGVMSERQHISQAYETNQRLLLELEEAQKSVRENQTRLELAQQAARMGVWQWDMDKNEVVWSLGAPALYGIGESTFRVSYEQWLEFVHPEDRAKVAASVQGALTGIQEHDLEFRTVPPSGGVRWLAGRGTVFRDAQGRAVRMVGICVDITELKSAQDALRQTHDELEVRVRDRTNELAESNRALLAEVKDRIQAQEALEFQTRRLREQSRLLDLANDAIIIRTLDGAVSYWNEGAERLYGWSKQDALARPMEELVHTEFPTPLEEIKKGLFQKGSWEGELLQRTQDGNEITVASNWTLWRDQEGTPRGWLQINSNISQRKNAEFKLRELSGRLLHLQDEERRRLARALHDSTGQSVAALQMNLTVIQKRTSGADEQAARILGDSLELTEQLLQEVRTLSYLLHPPLLDEAGLTSALRWYVDGLAQRSNIEINLDLPPQLGRLSQDLETAIFRLVQECLTNIHRHSSSPTAHIGITKDDSQVLLTVSDRGTGIPPNILNGTNGSSSVGVGISGMKERVRELGGHLQIRPADPGTVVHVVLPLKKGLATSVPHGTKQPMARAQA